MPDGINKYLGTSFTKNDMKKIYTYFGNSCNPDKLVSFVGSVYSMEKPEEMFEEDILKCVDKHNAIEFYAAVEFGNPNGCTLG